MPAKHTIREYQFDSYYHVFNRGVAKQKVFLEQADKQYFLQIIDRHLNPKTKQLNKLGFAYDCFADNLELLAYCLMDNHFHLLFYQGENAGVLSECMKSIGTAYTMYFNLKYQRVGPVFQGVFRASRISSDAYLLHISRYIHLNPRRYKTYRYSSLPIYLGHKTEPWLKPGIITGLFEGADYEKFLEDYEDQKQMLKEIELELADQ